MREMMIANLCKLALVFVRIMQSYIAYFGNPSLRVLPEWAIYMGAYLGQPKMAHMPTFSFEEF